MKKMFWKNLMAALLVLGLLTMISCAKKTITSQPETIKANDEVEVTSQDKDLVSAEEESIKNQELNEQLAMEKTLAEAQIAAAREKFIRRNIQFEFDSSQLSTEAKTLIEGKSQWLDANQGISITIEGHCDAQGTVEYNLALGERRAMAVKNYLLDLGVSASRMTWVSYGEEKPITSGQNEEEHRKNRRAQLVIQ